MHRKPPLFAGLRFGVLLASLPGLAGQALASDDLFSIQEIENRGRAVAAQIADLDGDGRKDLFVVNLVGVGSAEQRSIRVYLGRDGATLPGVPDFVVAVPEWSAVYDVGDVRSDAPGDELVLLQPRGLSVLSLASRDAPRWELPVEGPSTAGVASDERGFERFRMIYRDFRAPGEDGGPEIWLLVPQIGQLTALSPTGELRARISVPRRANYFITPSSGLIALESDFQVFVDVPKTTVGDVDGDGRADILSSTRHELRVFLQRSDGSFAFEPSRIHPLGLVTPRDHIRGSGGVTTEAGDIDGDGRLDLLISHVKGSFADATTTIYVYLNRGGDWRLDAPDESLSTEASLVSNSLHDLDRDGKSELLRVEFSFSLLEIVELLLSREIDIHVAVHHYEPGRGFGKRPVQTRNLSLPFSFETFRPKGFVPTAHVDVNGDGHLDFVLSGGGEAIEVHLGDERGPFTRRAGRQKLRTAGMIAWGPLDDDTLPDFVLFDPHNFDVPVVVGRNLGVLPGSPKRAEMNAVSSPPTP